MSCSCSSAEEHFTSCRGSTEDFTREGGVYFAGIRYATVADAQEARDRKQNPNRYRAVNCGCVSAEEHFIYRWCGSRT